MSIIRRKPTTPGQRHMSVIDYGSVLTTSKPKKSLCVVLKSNAGRNNQGRITVRHRGAGNKVKYRLVNFGQKLDLQGTVASVEYDPNRSAFISLVAYDNGTFGYIIAPEGIKVGDKVIASEKAKPKLGNRLKLERIPMGVDIHCIELSVGRGAQMVRSAGSRAQVVAKDGDWCHVKMPSGEVRLVNKNCWASVGAVSNADYFNVSIGKAGRKRKMGWRPTVRGSVMNPVDHPHGGGEGKAPIGMPGPKTPWGKPALGYKTRTATYSSKMILKPRKK